MTSGLSFLVAARQCEIGELEHLALTSELVSVIGRLIHGLQKERGMSNMYLASRGSRFGGQRLAQIGECNVLELHVRERLAALDTDAHRARNGARLFSRIAVVLHALDGLPALRQRVTTQALSPEASTVAFVRLVAGLLAVVFEAADSASDPAISRALVALFNFMQGKEFAGQERALGAAVFASGHADAGLQPHWQHLIESQQRCFEVFADFSDATVRAAWADSQPAEARATLERLRRLGSVAGLNGPLDADLSHTWYDCATSRIDAMQSVEALLAEQLRTLCRQRIEQARAELRNQQATLQALAREAGAADIAATDATEAPAPLTPHLERSVLGMVQEQSRRLQSMGDELETVRAALNERKVVERAKGLLMAARKLSEADAYAMLRQTAMSQNRKLVDVAESVLAMSDYLGA